jgi:hypothetical protein
MSEDRDTIWLWQKANWVQGSGDGANTNTGKNGTHDPKKNEPAEEKPAEKKPPEATVESVAIDTSQMLKEDNPFSGSGKLKVLDGATLTDFSLDVQVLYRYKDRNKDNEEKRDQAIGVRVDKQTLEFKFTAPKLFEPNAYDQDKEKPTDAKYRILVKVSGPQLDKEGVSAEVEVPAKGDKKAWSVKDGMIIHDDITQNHFPALEHGSISKVNALVLHRSDGDNVDGIFSIYKDPIKGKKADAAHFYIDAKGKIYQVGRIDRILWHVGKILSKDDAALNSKIDWISSQEAESLKKIILADTAEKKYLTELRESSFTKKITFNQYLDKLFDHEIVKQYPKRWPCNADSIGIEVTGVYNHTSNKYTQLTAEQEKSLLILIRLLVEHLNLCVESDVYPHGGIANKQITEGKELIEIVKNNLFKKENRK